MVYLSYGLLSFFNKENDMELYNEGKYVVDHFNDGTPLVIEECNKGGFEVFPYEGEGKDVTDSMFFFTLADVFEWATTQLAYDFDVKFKDYLTITKKETL
jgi:hypothetical protein